MKRTISIIALSLLAACGGGGGSGQDAAPRVAIYGDSLTSGDYTGGKLSPTPAERIAQYSSLPITAHAVQATTAPSAPAIADDAPVIVLRYGYADAVLGVSPADHRAAMERLVSRLSGRRVVIVGVLTAPEPYTAAAREINAVQRDIATRYGLQFIDVQSLGAVPLIDNIHPDRAGSDAVSMFIAKELVK